MRLSPKTIFFSLISLGLPIAVTVGWILGEPATSNPSAAANPGGAGSIGAAPDRDRGERPVKPVDYAAPAPGTVAPSASGAAPVTTPPSTSAVPPLLPVPTLPSLPPLTDPPVPTPTMVTSEPPSPSATPSTSPSADPSDIDTGGLFRSR